MYIYIYSILHFVPKHTSSHLQQKKMYHLGLPMKFVFCTELCLLTNFIHIHTASCVPFVCAGVFSIFFATALARPPSCSKCSFFERSLVSGWPAEGRAITPRCHFVGSKAWWILFVGNQKSQSLNFLGAPSPRASVFQPKQPENGGQKAVDAGGLKVLLPKWLGVVLCGLSGTLEAFRHFDILTFFRRIHMLLLQTKGAPHNCLTKCKILRLDLQETRILETT